MANLGGERSRALRTNPKFVPDNSDSRAGLIASEYLPGNRKPQRTTLVEQSRPVDQNLNLFTNWKNRLCLE
jgi:hypothetical protein